MIIQQVNKDIEDFELNDLIGFIEKEFHLFFEEILAELEVQLDSAQKVDSEVIKKIIPINKKFKQFKNLLGQHIGEEKNIVFPVIEKCINNNQFLNIIDDKGFDLVVKKMEGELSKMKKIVLEIEKETQSFKMPVNASQTYKNCIKKLDKLYHNYLIYEFVENKYVHPKMDLILLDN